MLHYIFRQTLHGKSHSLFTCKILLLLKNMLRNNKVINKNEKLYFIHSVKMGCGKTAKVWRTINNIWCCFFSTLHMYSQLHARQVEWTVRTWSDAIHIRQTFVLIQQFRRSSGISWKKQTLTCKSRDCHFSPFGTLNPRTAKKKKIDQKVARHLGCVLVCFFVFLFFFYHFLDIV